MRLTNRTNDPAAPPSAPAAGAEPGRAHVAAPQSSSHGWIDDRIRVAVGHNINISGKLAFTGPARIDGQFRGEISSNDLVVISETGAVDARVRTPRILILGEFHGEVLGARAVIIGPAARVKGRVEAERLTVNEGARIEADLVVGHPANAGLAPDKSES